MDGSAITPEVTAILTDLPYWHCCRLLILRVEPSPDNGVHLGVCGSPAAVEQRLRAHYDFPITCSVWE